MSQTSDPRAAYCPFAYGYSNYSRPRYAPFLLKAGGLVTFHGKRLRSTLGGAGIAVSSETKHPRASMDFALFTASPETQKGVYFQSGGQPGHRAAWTDDAVNDASNDFFRNTLQTLDESLLRPQSPGYMDFQDAATPVAHACVKGDITPANAAVEINRLYRNHLTVIYS
jgi:multiple sugar transport system substrate-binding protein